MIPPFNLQTSKSRAVSRRVGLRATFISAFCLMACGAVAGLEGTENSGEGDLSTFAELDADEGEDELVDKSAGLISTDSASRAGVISSGTALVEAEDDFNFGPHAVDQCDDPVATVSNSSGTFGSQNTLFFREADGTCPGDQGYCLGDCVEVVVKEAGGRRSVGINVIAGSDLPDPGNCSDVAIDKNDPPGSWDFTAAGACGKGATGFGNWHNCFVHDVCVWARCTDDDLIAGGLSVFGEGGIDDRSCGKAFDDARKDYLFANGPLGDFLPSFTPSCLADSQCPEGTDCKVGRCLQRGLSEGSICATDADCDGYCQLLTCHDGSEGDLCGNDSDCQDGLTCFGVRPGARCQRKKPEGSLCGADSNCSGYCQFLRCWDGSRGDKCGSTSDCQQGLSCKKRCRICAQKTCQ